MYALLNVDLVFDLISMYRGDEKSAQDFNITAGAVLHLVLALRGGI